MNREPLKQAAADTATAAANTAVTLTYAAATATRHALAGVIASYSASPTGGNLKIEDGAGTTVFQLDLVGAGPHMIPFDPALLGSPNTALVITLAAGGSGVVGKLNARHFTY